ncbi:hypothetical protein ASD64_11790 [Mesorhizobium sp. Root157]|nr:hypothetical protein ASD64_11790 [Mesorhizobium sp. Root157]
MQYGYDARRSWWQEVKAHAHLVIAAVGTMSLLAVAAVALWLAMPAGERQAFAEAKVDQQPEIVAPATAISTDSAGITAPETEPPPVHAVETASVVQQPEAPMAQPEIPELDPQAAAAIAVPAVDGDGTAPLAYSGKDGAAQQMPLIAAIPTPRPTPPGEAGGTDTDAKTPKDGAPNDAASGHTLRAVTMRSGPKTGAAAIGTVPAKTPVEVVACEKWCEIVYEGKRGFVYKSFVQRD